MAMKKKAARKPAVRKIAKPSKKRDVKAATQSVAMQQDAPSPATSSSRDVQKHEEMERSGTIGRQAHASVRNRRMGG